MNASRILAIGLLTLAATVANADGRISERLAATSDGLVEVSNVAGSVQLIGWSRGEVEVEGTHGAGVERIEFTSENGHTVVRVHLVRRAGRDARNRNLDGDANLVIRVPQRARMRVSTVSANVHAEGLDGPVDLRSVSGDIDVGGGYTDADLQSVSGTVVVRSSGRDARITAGSISGLVQVDAMSGELTGNSVSGVVRVATPGIRRALLKSISGDVVVEGPIAADTVYEIEAVSGNARLATEGLLDARFELHTFSGSIQNGFGPPPERTSRYAPGQTLDFTEGQGSAQVSMRSLSGSLRLDRK